jgi:DNA invertase Pin-like site-specific DNA recombinase
LSSDAISCVIYAAKSTEDRRGSIAGQLRDCAEAIAEDPHRAVVGEYTDESFSAYRASRGPGLSEAMTHVLELAGEGRKAELWAQHSDRLARGDSRSARHAVEIALWALKRDVHVHTLQDPDTFRDLLYAVVTGQRNHEDSRRKALATSAGMRRSAERGECIGGRPDGYKFAVEVSDNGAITKHLEIDPERQPIIETVFRMGLRGKRTGQIARALNDAGWHTKPLARSRAPQTWTCHSVLGILRNPRYAALATLKGEIIGHGHWPAYITEAQHHRIRKHLAKRRPPPRFRPVKCYLLARLARCGKCGAPLHVHTGLERNDGSLTRRYGCSSHSRDRHAERCDAPRIDADVVEPMFVAALAALLTSEEPSTPPGPRSHSYAGERWIRSAERERVLTAVTLGDDAGVNRALEGLLALMRPDRAIVETQPPNGRLSRQLELLARLQAWVAGCTGAPTERSREELNELRLALCSLFSSVTLVQSAFTITIGAQRAGSGAPAELHEVQLDRREWRRLSRVTLQACHAHMRWDELEIVGALQRWADKHGGAPRSSDWTSASVDHPTSSTVRLCFTSWSRALRHAGLTPLNPRASRRWRDEEIIRTMCAWAIRRGRRPRQQEWIRATPWRPCKTTVCNHFGSWPAALAAAGLADTT